MISVHLFLFKRDFRFHDHPALSFALNSFLVSTDPNKHFLMVTCDPEFDFGSKVYSDFHRQFLQESVHDLNRQLEALELTNRVLWAQMNRIDLVKRILKEARICAVYSSEETGNKATFHADLEFQSFLKAYRIPWYQKSQYSVLRGSQLKNHSLSWSDHWEQFYVKSPLEKNILAVFQEHQNMFSEKSGRFLSKIFDSSLFKTVLPSDQGRQTGGETEGLRRVSVFFEQHAFDYFKSISKPSQAEIHGSRLSPYLAWGNLSLRSLIQTLRKEQQTNFRARRSLQAFESRLHWRDHFIQRFEQNPQIETENLNPLFNSIRNQSDQTLHRRFFAGETGYPLVDAVMRCLKQTGFVNFRSRAMITSFYTHHLWLPWQDLAKDLSQIFLDYEPGIHYCQLQMQAGTMGMHTMRIYNPSLQATEKDASGDFIRRWVPELKELPPPFLHRPWDLTPFEEISYGFQIGKSYPQRIVMTEETGRRARDVLWGLKNTTENESFHRQFRGHEKRLRKISQD